MPAQPTEIAAARARVAATQDQFAMCTNPEQRKALAAKLREQATVVAELESHR